LFERFPEVEGVVTRIGEGDGVDVESAFKSRVVIRTARQCNRWIRAMLPEFESRGKLLIFRTWSLGAYAIGDINWNERTQRRAFGEIDSPAFVVSHKYGPGDFFRHLPLNEFIREGRQAQIIELQARREYEGFGEFPAYVGRQYEALRDALGGCDSLRGISVWCQTGGWSHFDRLTFLDGSSPWNELNAVAAIRLFTSDVGADEVLDEFCAARFRVGEAGRMAELVRQFDHLVDQLWYFNPFARRALWFRRLRVPPLLWIFWDTILVNRAFRLVLHAYHERPKELRKVDKLLRRELWAMRELIADGDAESDGLRRAVETFELLVVLRRFYVGKAGRKRQRKIERKVMAYRERHPAGFGVECDFAPFRIRWVSSWVIFGMLIRGRARYRLFDRLVLIPLSGWLFPWFKRWQRRRIPAVAGRQAAGVEFFFR